MNKLKSSDGVSEGITDPLAPHRERIMYPILIAGVICFTPFVVNSFVQGWYGRALVTLVVIVTYVVDAWAIRHNKRPPVPFALLLVPTAASMAVSLAAQGIHGALWAYPAVLSCYFVLSRRMANVCALALLGGATVMVYRYVGPGIAIRFCASLALTIAVANCILWVVSELQRELLDQAITDPLTGAFNRRHMNQLLAETVERSRRTGAPATLLLLDIDNFKVINDQLGHDAGDHVLRELVKTIKGNTRKTDQLFRMGGEEFLLLLPDTSTADAMTAAEHLRSSIEKSRPLDDWPVTISVGVSQHEPDQIPAIWIKQADDALYLAKEGGRNQVVCST